MKILSDGKGVTPRTYYYLLEFNDRDNWKTILDMFGKMKLRDLTIHEYKKLFIYATQQDIKLLEDE